MKKMFYFLVFFMVCLIPGARSQVITSNSFFESGFTPTLLGQGDACFTVYDGVPQGGGQIDYFHRNPCLNFQICIPANIYGREHDVNNGNGYIGFHMWYRTGPISSDREYFGIWLADSTVGGNYYKVEVMASLADSSRYTFDNFALSLGATFHTFNFNLVDTSGWTLFVDTIQALAGSDILYIGSLNPFTSTPPLVEVNPQGAEYAYYYLGMVRITDLGSVVGVADQQDASGDLRLVSCTDVFGRVVDESYVGVVVSTYANKSGKYFSKKSVRL